MGFYSMYNNHQSPANTGKIQGFAEGESTPPPPQTSANGVYPPIYAINFFLKKKGV